MARTNGFNELAQLEEAKRTEFAKSIQQQLAERRAKLAQALTEQGQQLFNFANPGILEDLNSRGLFNSPTAVNQAQTDALKQIALANQGELNQFDNAATGYGLQSQQDALDAGLDLRRSELENQLQQSQAAREEALARDLAKQQARQNLYGSLIGTAGNLGSIYATSKLLGLGGTTSVPTGLAGGAGLPSAIGNGTGLKLGSGALINTAPGAGISVGPGASITGTAAPSALSSFFGSTGAVPGSLALAGAGLGASALARAGEKKYGTLGGVLANPIGYQLNKAKQFIRNPGKTIVSGVKDIGKKLFCFDPETPIFMEDGKEKEIRNIKIGDKTKGGIVQSIRTSITEEGTVYERKGIKVTGSHAVKENGVWIRVEDSVFAKPIEGPAVVLSLVTTEHRIYVKDDVFGDEHETVQYEDLNLEESLDRMNYDDRLQMAVN